jgi:hypothetical protein
MSSDINIMSEALGFGPLAKACWADAFRVERIPSQVQNDESRFDAGSESCKPTFP